jgi:hypothetical protein
MSTIFGVHISLIDYTFRNISFVFGALEFYFALLYTRIFYIEYALVVGCRLKSYKKNMESVS